MFPRLVWIGTVVWVRAVAVLAIIIIKLWTIRVPLLILLAFLVFIALNVWLWHMCPWCLHPY